MEESENMKAYIKLVMCIVFLFCVLHAKLFAASSDLWCVGSATVGECVSATGAIIPSADGTHNLGSAAKSFGSAWMDGTLTAGIISGTTGALSSTLNVLGNSYFGAAGFISTMTAANGNWDMVGNIVSLGNISGVIGTFSNTSAGSLDIGGGLNAGTGNVGIIDASGKIPALSSTYLTSLSGANLTALTPGNISAGALNSVTDLTATGNIKLGAANYVSTMTGSSGNWDITGNIVSLGNISGVVGTFSSAGAGSLDIGGGLNAGSGNVGIIDTSGKIPALSSTYIADLSGANLTALVAANISAGNLGSSVVASSYSAVAPLTATTGAFSSDVSVGGLISNGTASVAKAVTLADSYLATQTNVESQTNPGSEYSLIGMYGKASTKAGTDMPNIQLVGMAARADMHSDALDAYGLQSHLTISAGAASATGNMTAVSGKTVLADGVASGIITAGLFTLEGPSGAAVSPNLAYGIWADVVDTNIHSGIMVHANGSTLGSGITFTKTGTGAITKDITLQNAETISNAVDGTIAITAPALTQSGTLTVTGNTALNGGLTFGGTLTLQGKSIADLMGMTPTAIGQMYTCSDCSPVEVAISTAATGIGAYGNMLGAQLD